MAQRTCARCGRSPDEVAFRKDKRRKSDGLGAYCKPCERQYNRDYHAARRERHNAESAARYQRNRERYLARQRAHRLANLDAYRRRDRARYPARRAERLFYLAAWRARQDPEATREYLRNWYEANRERHAAGSKAWRARNADRVSVYVARRLMRMRGLNGTIERIDRRAVWLRDDGLCGLCGYLVAFDAMHLDHIKPLVRGGPHTFDNVQPAHPRCNLRKKDREVARWAFGNGSVPSPRQRISVARSVVSTSS